MKSVDIRSLFYVACALGVFALVLSIPPLESHATSGREALQTWVERCRGWKLSDLETCAREERAKWEDCMEDAEDAFEEIICGLTFDSNSIGCVATFNTEAAKCTPTPTPTPYDYENMI